MKLVTAAEMATIDREASAHGGIPSLLLMENAGRTIANVVRRDNPEAKRIAVLCGKGNNAGDGFVAARHLASDHSVVVFLSAPPESLRGDAATNYALLKAYPLEIRRVQTENLAQELVRIGDADLLIDAIFGTGLQGALSADHCQWIQGINRSGVPILAVDIPSGLDADTGQALGEAIHAQSTLTMGLPKRGLYAPAAAEWVGQILVADLSYPPALLQDDRWQGTLLEPALFHGLLPRRTRDSHKGTYGTVLVIAGSLRYRGAANLAGLGALRAGAGLVQLALPQSLCLANRRKADEMIQLPLTETKSFGIALAALEETLEAANQASAVVLGPGLGTSEETRQFARQFTLKNKTPLILDADGLNAFTADPSHLLQTPAPLVMTPHPGELARLLGCSVAALQIDRIGRAQEASARFDCLTILKGYRTVIAEPGGRFYLNPTGNPGMASGGMGDVLAGILGGLVAQGLPLLEASLLASFAHGLAGDLVASELGERGLLASDLLPLLPKVLEQLTQHSS
jgi:hydroxyethylthiazole kinase-like uncharacterized protein yjeF